MNNNWYDTQDWYAPAPEPVQESASLPSEPAESRDKKRKKRRGWTPGRVLGIISVVVLLIVASSLAFSSPVRSDIVLPDEGFLPPRSESREDGPASEDDSGADEEDGDTPRSWHSFFETYFRAEETDKLNVGIQQAVLPINFTLSLTPQPGGELSLQKLYETGTESIVGISAWTDDSDGYSWGTGVILSSDGLILTNTHVINDTDYASVLLNDGIEYDAELVGADTITDIAVLKIQAENLPVASFGLSGELQVGDPVAAIGNPLGVEFRNTLTTGIISAIERGVSYHGRTMTLLQTDAALNEGNSGGALFNYYGQVVGITNMKMMSSYSSIEGIGFAIPSATVQTAVNSIVKYGEVRGRTAIGITVGAVPENASSTYEIPSGLYVTAVSPGSDAEKQGVLAGDIVTAINGQPVSSTADVMKIKDALQVGDPMTLHIWREGEELDITIHLMDNNDVYGK